jgi:hypothetical protein
MYYQGCVFYQSKPSVALFNSDLSLIEATDSGYYLAVAIGEYHEDI